MRLKIERCAELSKEHLCALFDEDLSVHPSKYASSIEISRVALEIESDFESFLLGPETVTTLQTVYRFLSHGREPVFAFIFHLHDNIARELVMLAKLEESHLVECLELFRDHPTKEGGIMLLGLASQRARLLFTFTYEPVCECWSQFYGGETECKTLEKMAKA